MLWITSRSRSSLVSSIFIKHNVWWGNTPKQISGYTSWENQNIKALQNRFKAKYWKKIHLTPVSSQWNAEFINQLKKIVPENQTWMMKTGVEYFNAFKDLIPYNIFIRRPADQVAKSLTSKRADVIYDDALYAAEWRFDFMDKLKAEYGGVDVHTDKIIQGDFSEIKEAIEYCGLKFDEKAANQAIVR